jgi:transposase
MRKLVSTLREHSENIVSFIDTHLTNAVAEGLNRIIKNRASGFMTLEAFTDMIFLTVGDVDIPAQIPARLRAI